MLRQILLLVGLTGLPRLVFRLMRDRRVPLWTKLILPAAALYLIFPLDILPDILPVLGQIDDLLVLLVAVALFLSLVPPEVVREHGGAVGRDSRGSEPTRGAKENVIEGSYRVVDDGQ